MPSEIEATELKPVAGFVTVCVINVAVKFAPTR